LIVDLEYIEEINEWLDGLLQHRYLKFTHEHNLKSINFLDVQVSLSESNKIITCLYTKPMSKHMYLHAHSDHPAHLKNSLFYSQGLRVVRICSEFTDRLKALCLLYEKFVVRDYTQNILYPTFMRLVCKSRKEALCPKKNLLCTYLSVHNPDILTKYNIPLSTLRSQVIHEHSASTMYAIFPFYKSVSHYKQVLQRTIFNHIKTKCVPEYRVFVESLCLKIVFSRTKNLKEELQV